MLSTIPSRSATVARVRRSQNPSTYRPVHHNRNSTLCRYSNAGVGVASAGTHTSNGNGNGNGAVDVAALAPAPVVPVVQAVPGVVPPAKAYEIAVAAGAAKAALPWGKILQLGVLAGAYIAFGAFLAVSVGGACPGLAATNPGLQKIVMGSFGLPFGLLMVIICGAELFTGNTALVTLALYEKKASLGQLIKSWAVSYAGNAIGAALLVLAVYGSGLLGSAAAPQAIAVAKTSLTFSEAFLRGLMCNWLVCLAIWQASAASTLSGKALGVYFPISAFVALGLEHSVANMFLVPIGILLGAPVTWGAFLTANLLPVTLGNIVAGSLCVATAYFNIYGAKPKTA